MSENRLIDDPFERSSREIFYTNQALEMLEAFEEQVGRYIHKFAIKMAKDRIADSDKDITIEMGDAIEAIDDLRFSFGKDFFEFTEEDVK